ncbi:ground-like domain protein [Dictyocaulus viviparus]|uniref:Ground-like domain protein n=1 Tax=Dictyocaulus viviparus TaxID=29172 RepID=A0A0D8XG57_DICVI|nr:ground-like domain protein [Dictyocaulus viviparus]
MKFLCLISFIPLTSTLMFDLLGGLGNAFGGSSYVKNGVISDMNCNNDELKKIMEKVMSNDEAESQSKISTALISKNNNGVVICTSNPFKFSTSSSTDFCSVKNEKFTCYAFVF